MYRKNERSFVQTFKSSTEFLAPPPMHHSTLVANGKLLSYETRHGKRAFAANKEMSPSQRPYGPGEFRLRRALWPQRLVVRVWQPVVLPEARERSGREVRVRDKANERQRGQEDGPMLPSMPNAGPNSARAELRRQRS